MTSAGLTGSGLPIPERIDEAQATVLAVVADSISENEPFAEEIASVFDGNITDIERMKLAVLGGAIRNCRRPRWFSKLISLRFPSEARPHYTRSFV
ncbi:MAG: hypothetical protein ABL921_33785, partial [Pirellula sp.]